MICERCGSEMPDEAFYCDNCGVRVGSEYIAVDSACIADIPVVQTNQPNATVDPPSAPFDLQLDRTMVIGIAIIGLAVAIIIIAVIGWFIIPNMIAAASA